MIVFLHCCALLWPRSLFDANSVVGSRFSSYSRIISRFSFDHYCGRSVVLWVRHPRLHLVASYNPLSRTPVCFLLFFGPNCLYHLAVGHWSDPCFGCLQTSHGFVHISSTESISLWQHTHSTLQHITNLVFNRQSHVLPSPHCCRIQNGSQQRRC